MFKHALILIMAVITFALYVLINASIVHHQPIVFHAKEGIRLTPTKHVYLLVPMAIHQYLQYV